MASRSEITEALRWCSSRGLDPWTVTGACASVGIEHAEDTGDMIVKFVAYSKAKIAEKGPQ